jgi:hypothetical protein
MIFVNYFHTINAIFGLFFATILAIIICVYNVDIAIYFSSYFLICLLSIGIAYIFDKESLSFGSVERAYCWSIYYGTFLYGFKTFDADIYLVCILISSLWGYQYLYNNYNMTLQHTNVLCKNHPTILCKNNVRINLEVLDIYKFMKNAENFIDMIKRFGFLVELNIYKDKYINHYLMEIQTNCTCENINLDDIDNLDQTPERFLDILYKNILK